VASWIAAIVDTGGRADFWTVVRRHHVFAAIDTVPARALIGFSDLRDFEASTRLAQELSTAVSTTAIGLFMQTVSDVYGLRVFTCGQLVRRIDYSRDEGGWVEVSGTPQSWEPVLFFDGPASPDATRWPDTIYDDLDDADLTRYEAARQMGDAAPVMDLVHATGGGIHRVVKALGVTPDKDDAQYHRPRWWRRFRK